MTLLKSFADVTVKDANRGLVSAVFSTFGVVDLDGDVTLPGAITDGAAVVISAYGHKSWEGVLPVGKGVLRTTDAEAILEGQFFLGTTSGRETFEVVKGLAEAGLGEWSYSLTNVVSERGEWEGRPVQILKRIEVREVSPVLRGAGIGTRTLAAKAYNQGVDLDLLANIAQQHRIRTGMQQLNTLYPKEIQ